MTGQMICQNCGTQIEEGMSFCPKCGMKVCQGQQFQCNECKRKEKR